ncbi:MAG: hypothetical protein A2172_03870 [Candidatus Woykebacteria bacterium RBG_13_40_15]|uniref:SH3b domain-containing protein n=1 Tax=Candidatus Woykebacteria bacterium RBG_13_40_15 TaxID=1802593 RepID=A0A1G1WAA2_9BACT|nr:MAG: hypothetical protein A2172_03870 [Candidatus Woykebacteria bacterium RBG_13_40_15]
MRRFLPKLLFYYSAIAAFLITISTIFSSQSIGPVIFATLFLPVTAYFIIEFFKQVRSLLSPTPVEGTDISSGPKKGEIIIFTLIFLLLLGVGFRNIYFKSGAQGVPLTSPTQVPLVFKTTSTPTPIRIVQISITDSSSSARIYQKPTIYSAKIGNAKDGDMFEFIASESGWYQIRLASDSAGFIPAKYVKEVAE